MRQGNFSRIVLAILKLTVFLACIIIGMRYLNRHQPNWNTLIWHHFTYLIIPVLLLLTTINWLLEAKKWQMLVSTIQDVSYAKAIKATLSGVATSFITPFRIGDFVGRVMHLESKKRDSTVLTFFGNLNQLLATLIFGMIGLSYLGNSIFDLNNSVFQILLITGWVATSALAFLVLFPSATLASVKLFEWLSITKEILNIPSSLTYRVLSLALLRYLVFLTQFVCCLKMYGSSLDIWHLAFLVTVLYLCITFIPSPVLGKLGVRESVGLFLMSPYEETAIILAASLTIWTINLFIPALVGAAYFWGLKSKARK